MSEQKSLRVTKSNDLIVAAYRLSLSEQRLILAAIAKVDPRRPMPKVISVSATDYADIYGLPLRHAYAQMREASDDLYEREIRTFDGKIHDRMRWVDRARYIDGEGRVELFFTIHVIPYLAMLHSRVTSYDLRRVAALDSVHSFRLFEMLMQFKRTGWRYMEIEELRKALCLTDAYQRFNNLRQRVIDPAVEELNSKSDLDVTYELKYDKRKVVAIKFIFTDKLKKQSDADENDLDLLDATDVVDEQAGQLIEQEVT